MSTTTSITTTSMPSPTRRKVRAPCNSGVSRTLLTSVIVTFFRLELNPYCAVPPIECETTLFTPSLAASDFTSGNWLKFALAAAAVAGFYKFAPEQSEDAPLTRFMAHYMTPAEAWAKLNAKHLELTSKVRDDTLFTHETTKSPVKRYRYPQFVIPRSLDMSGRLTQGWIVGLLRWCRRIWRRWVLA
jgi:hypothetical protein